MPYSHHSHSGQFCKHALGSLEDVVLEAIRQKFVVYALTEHVPRYRKADLYPEEGGMTTEELEAQFEAFLVEAHRLKACYASQITLLVGAETEFITELDFDGLDKLLDRNGNRIEFLVGSIHHVNEVPIDFDKPTFYRLLETFAATSCHPGDTTQMEKLMVLYFDAQYEVLRRFRPEIVGHIDLCRLYFPALDFHAYPEIVNKLERNIRFAVGYGALFEFNAAAFRKGWHTAYPGPDVVQLIDKLGGRFTISDDSHGPEAVGLNYDRLYKYLRDLNLQEIWYLSANSESEINPKGRILSPVRADGQWWADAFWNERRGPWTDAHPDA